VVYESDKKYDLAINDYSKALEININHKEIYLLHRGISYVSLGKNDLAIADLTRALELDPTSVDGFVWLGHAYANSHAYDQAVAAYQKALKISPSAYTSCVLGVTYTKMADFPSAVSALEQGIKLDGSLTWCKTALDNARQNIPTP